VSEFGEAGDGKKQIKERRRWVQWITPVTLATQEEEIRRITVQDQPSSKVGKV
jgi:hypothetical protein